MSKKISKIILKVLERNILNFQKFCWKIRKSLFEEFWKITFWKYLKKIEKYPHNSIIFIEKISDKFSNKDFWKMSEKLFENNFEKIFEIIFEKKN